MNREYPIACTIGICDGFNMVLPANLIADVVSSMTYLQIETEAAWAVGELSWRGLEIPVISIEQIIIARAPRIKGSHVAIFQGTNDTDKLPFYAVPMQAIPHNFNLVKESDLSEREDDLDLACCKVKVTARGVASIIPDLQAIEEKILANIQVSA